MSRREPSRVSDIIPATKLLLGALGGVLAVLCIPVGLLLPWDPWGEGGGDAESCSGELCGQREGGDVGGLGGGWTEEGGVRGNGRG